MSSFFINRAYPESVVRKALSRAQTTPRHSALQPKPAKHTDRPTAILPFHPHSLPISRILKSNWHILSKNTSIAPVFKHQLMITYRRDKNLRDLLVRSKLSHNSTPTPPGTSRCSANNCKTCPYISPDTTLRGPTGTHTITRSFTCHSRNIIYAIRCSHCQKIYIGETSRTLNTRISEHLADIRHKRSKPVATHFNSPNHTITHVQVLALWQNHGDCLDRLTQESFLISKLGSLSPAGLNLQK